MARIIMLVHEENGRFGASFPDLPGCTTVAGDLNTLITKAPAVAAFHLEGLAGDAGVAPAVRTLSELRADPDFLDDARGAMIVLLDVDLPGRTVRVNITLEEAMLKRIDHAAQNAGETRSGFLVSAARSRLMAS